MTAYEEILERTRLSSEASEALSAIQSTLALLPGLANTLVLNDTAQKYLRQGVLNRYLSIEGKWRWILFNLPIDRKAALCTGDARTASMHLNSLYLHTKGVLDNFAWLYLHQLDPGLAQSIIPSKVSLFSKEILAVIPDCDEKHKLTAFSTWHNDMCRRRHPVAHRLPLHIPSQVHLSQDEVKQRQELEAQWNENIEKFAKESSAALLAEDPHTLDIHGLNRRNQQVTERIEALERQPEAIEEEIRSLGTFVPGFMYPEEDVIYPIYPTVTDDIKELNNVICLCLKILEKICKD